MNLFERNCVPQSQTGSIQNAKNTHFLTTNQPLAVQANEKYVEHASSTVNRRVFGPNDMVVMTTWVDKYVVSTVKTTTVGKPVVSDSVRLPSELVGPKECQPSKNESVQRRISTESSIQCPVPGACANPECHPQPNTSGQRPCSSPQTDNSSSQTTPSLMEVISQTTDEPELNEERTDSEDGDCTDSEDEESDTIDV